MHLIVDGDQMIFACGFSAEGEDDSHAFHLVNKRIEKMLEDTGCDTYSVYIKGEGNFRDEVALDYKANRKSRKPSNYKPIVNFLCDRHGATKVDGMEADDQTSILLYKDYKESGKDPEQASCILASPDKDLNNTPGWHYNPMKSSLYWVSSNQAMRHFLFQMLTGDTVDNIPGLPYVTDSYRKLLELRSSRIGKATAKKLMSSTEEWKHALQVVRSAYLNWGEAEGLSVSSTIEYFSEQGSLLWMIREVDSSGMPVMFDGDRLWQEG